MITRPHRGVSAEQRLARRRAQLLDAGLDLLGREGMGGTTVTAVCRRAALSTRYFYESFADLEQLLLALYDQLMDEGVAVVLGAIAAPVEVDPDLYTLARAPLEAAIVHLTDDPRRARVLLVESIGVTGLQARRQRALIDNSRLLAEITTQLLGEKAPPRGDLELIAYALVGGLAETMVAYVGGALETDRDELIDRLTRLFVAGVRAAAPDFR